MTVKMGQTEGEPEPRIDRVLFDNLNATCSLGKGKYTGKEDWIRIKLLIDPDTGVGHVAQRLRKSKQQEAV